MKVLFKTLGCKVNQYDEMTLSAQLESNGFKVVTELDKPDICVVNSCTVTAESNRKTRQAVHRFKKKFPDCILVLTGCMAQAFTDECSDIEGVDLVIGNTEYPEFSSILKNYIANRSRVAVAPRHISGEKYTELGFTSSRGKTRAFIKIEDGCDQFCTYCIIPYARGRVRSRKLEDIKNEALQLAENGFAEIVLVGINLSAYGTDIGCDLCDAVETVANIPGIYRVRLGSLEPEQITDDVIRRLAVIPKFCPQFHLSLQAGCDSTLKRMNRRYDTAFYKNLVETIRTSFNNPAITTDIMVGFAGENEADFLQSVKFAEDIGFAKAHVFAYSRREGTVAYNLPGQVSNAEKQRRSEIMIAACNAAEKKFLQTQVGKTCKVLFEEKKNGFWWGYSDNYTRVAATSDFNIAHKLLTVKIISAADEFCFSEII